ncbi:conserved hypothetical protein [Candidatus Magnetomoraceae bacterium gMMP-1]
MGKKDLDQFIEKKSKIKKEFKEIDWENKKNEWLEYLHQFYEKVKNWLKDYKDKGVIDYDFVPTDIYEENIGQYKAEKMVLNITNEQIVFEPIGTILIGAKGRIDMKGKNGIVKFVLVNKKAKGTSAKISISNDAESEKEREWQWKIATPPPSIKYIDLDNDTFSDCILDLIND